MPQGKFAKVNIYSQKSSPFTEYSVKRFNRSRHVYCYIESQPDTDFGIAISPNIEDEVIYYGERKKDTANPFSLLAYEESQMNTTGSDRTTESDSSENQGIGNLKRGGVRLNLSPFRPYPPDNPPPWQILLSVFFGNGNYPERSVIVFTDPKHPDFKRCVRLTSRLALGKDGRFEAHKWMFSGNGTSIDSLLENMELEESQGTKLDDEANSEKGDGADIASMMEKQMSMQQQLVPEPVFPERDTISSRWDVTPSIVSNNSLGVIRVVLHRVQVSYRATPEGMERGLLKTLTSKIAKGSGSDEKSEHAAKVGTAKLVEKKDVQPIVYEYYQGDKTPIEAFWFYYRSRETLEHMGLVERVPQARLAQTLDRKLTSLMPLGSLSSRVSGLVPGTKRVRYPKFPPKPKDIRAWLPQDNTSTQYRLVADDALTDESEEDEEEAVRVTKLTRKWKTIEDDEDEEIQDRSSHDEHQSVREIDEQMCTSSDDDRQTKYDSESSEETVTLANYKVRNALMGLDDEPMKPMWKLHGTTGNIKEIYEAQKSVRQAMAQGKMMVKAEMYDEDGFLVKMEDTDQDNRVIKLEDTTSSTSNGISVDDLNEPHLSGGTASGLGLNPAKGRLVYNQIGSMKEEEDEEL